MKCLLASSLVLSVSIFPALAQDSTKAPPPPQLVSASRLADIPLHEPADAAKALVVYFSDISGWKPSDDAVVSALQADGDAVLAVDLARYAQALDADDGECLYVVGEITDLAQTAQRILNIQSYLPAIVAGSGQGATFAYAALADAPFNTLGGAVAYGFTNQLDLKHAFCPGAASTKTADGKGYSYGFNVVLPEDATLLVPSDDVDKVTDAAKDRDNVTVDEMADADGAAEQITQAVSDLSESNDPFGDLPAVDLPSQGKPKALAILVSGDGGWRDLDKTMGEWLSTQGVHVVGLDSLRYFWSKRKPEELAKDIETLVKDADPDKSLPVMLIGYSFGADTIPFAYPLLPKPIQDRTRVLALMAPGATTSFQVTVSGWLGVDDSGYEIVPAIAALPKDRVVCVYGKDDIDETACSQPALASFTKVETEGGHHFDGNYEAIAQRFLDRLK